MINFSIIFFMIGKYLSKNTKLWLFTANILHFLSRILICYQTNRFFYEKKGIFSCLTNYWSFLFVFSKTSLEIADSSEYSAKTIKFWIFSLNILKVLSRIFYFSRKNHVSIRKKKIFIVSDQILIFTTPFTQKFG